MVFVTILMLTLVGGIAYLAVILIETRVLHYLPKRALGGFSLSSRLIHREDLIPVAVGTGFVEDVAVRQRIAVHRARMHDAAIAHVGRWPFISLSIAAIVSGGAQ